MPSCSFCGTELNRHDNLQQRLKNKHQSSSKSLTFQHPFSMMVTGPSQSGKTEWTRKLLLSSLIQTPPERILWCFGPSEGNSVHRIYAWHLSSPKFTSPGKKDLIILDDLMTEVKCDQRITDLYQRQPSQK